MAGIGESRFRSVTGKPKVILPIELGRHLAAILPTGHKSRGRKWKGSLAIADSGRMTGKQEVEGREGFAGLPPHGRRLAKEAVVSGMAMLQQQRPRTDGRVLVDAGQVYNPPRFSENMRFEEDSIESDSDRFTDCVISGWHSHCR